MSNVATQACIQFRTALAAMTGQPGIGLVANGVVDGEIEFVNPGDELVPFEPVIRLGREAERATGPKMREVRNEEGRLLVHAGHYTGFFADQARIKHILTTPLREYLPDKDPRGAEPVEAGRAWDRVRARSLNDLVEAVRTVRAVTHVEDGRHPTHCGPIPDYGFSFIGALIWDRGMEFGVETGRKLEHMLVSAILLYETTLRGFDFTREMSNRVSQVAEEYAGEGHHDAAAMLHERALQMLIPFRRRDGKDEVLDRIRAEVMVKAASEWFEARTKTVDIDTHRWRLSRGMRLAWEGDDLSLLGRFHDAHQSMLDGFNQDFEGAKSRVRHAATEVERLRRSGWGLGDRFANWEAWKTIASRLQTAHDLFEESGHNEFADEADVLSEQARSISEQYGSEKVS